MSLGKRRDYAVIPSGGDQLVTTQPSLVDRARRHIEQADSGTRLDFARSTAHSTLALALLALDAREREDRAPLDGEGGR